MAAADPFGGATLQINKVFANGRLKRWPGVMGLPHGPPRHGMRATTFAFGLRHDFSLPTARLQHFCHHPAANLTTVQDKSRSVIGQNSPLCGWSLALGIRTGHRTAAASRTRLQIIKALFYPMTELE
jgi:hypothetical protein